MAGVKRLSAFRKRRLDAKKARVAELRAAGVGLRTIAKEVGVSDATVRRWINPEARARSNEASRIAKTRRTGVCKDCGGLTRYNGDKRKPISSRCAACQALHLNSPERVAAQTIWSHEKLIELIQQWGAEHGEPPRVSDWRWRSGDYPSFTTVIKYFGSWNNAIEAAGMEPRLPTDRLLAAGERKKGEDR